MNEHTSTSLSSFVGAIIPNNFSVQHYREWSNNSLHVFITIKKGEQEVLSQSDHIRIYLDSGRWNIVTDVDGVSQCKDAVKTEVDIQEYLKYNLIYIE